MVELEGQLRAIGHSPLAQLTIFEGAGHVCSTLVDSNLLFGKIRLMLLRSGRVGETATISVANASHDKLCTLSRSDALATLSAFADRLGLGCIAGAGNHLQVTRNHPSTAPLEVRAHWRHRSRRESSCPSGADQRSAEHEAACLDSRQIAPRWRRSSSTARQPPRLRSARLLVLPEGGPYASLSSPHGVTDLLLW